MLNRYKKRAVGGGYSEFYRRCVENIKLNGLHCEECGDKLIGDVSEVAHILEKQKFKSVATNDRNIIYLCSWKSRNNCHSLFDGSSEQLQRMNVFENTKKIVKCLLENEVHEKFNWKITDRWLL